MSKHTPQLPLARFRAGVGAHFGKGNSATQCNAVQRGNRGRRHVSVPASPGSMESLESVDDGAAKLFLSFDFIVIRRE